MCFQSYSLAHRNLEVNAFCCPDDITILHNDDMTNFCLINVTGFSAKNRKSIKYHSLPLTMRPVPHDDNLLVLKPQEKLSIHETDEHVQSTSQAQTVTMIRILKYWALSHNPVRITLPEQGHCQNQMQNYWVQDCKDGVCSHQVWKILSCKAPKMIQQISLHRLKT